MSLAIVACPTGTYKNNTDPGDMATCIPCPDEHHISPRGSASVTSCYCRRGYHDAGNHRCAGEAPYLSRHRRSLPLPKNQSNLKLDYIQSFKSLNQFQKLALLVFLRCALVIFLTFLSENLNFSFISFHTFHYFCGVILAIFLLR